MSAEPGDAKSVRRQQIQERKKRVPKRTKEQKILFACENRGGLKKEAHK